MDVVSVDIRNMASASDVVFEALRAAIVEGRIADGEVLRQDQIANLFNVSRIPVREALARLEEHGLVTTQRYRGAIVTALSPSEISEIFEFRALLEGELVKLSVRNMTDETKELAKKYHHEFANDPNSENWAALNLQFHYALYRDANRPYYLQVAHNALNRVGRYLRAQLVLTDGMTRARAEHQRILDACIAGDAEAAARLTRQHILDAGRSLIESLPSSPAAGGKTVKK